MTKQQTFKCHGMECTIEDFGTTQRDIEQAKRTLKREIKQLQAKIKSVNEAVVDPNCAEMKEENIQYRSKLAIELFELRRRLIILDPSNETVSVRRQSKTWDPELPDKIWHERGIDY